jgi:uncharacterized membrane protein
MNKILSKAVLTIILSLASLSDNGIHSQGSVKTYANSINNLGQTVEGSRIADASNLAIVWNNRLVSDFYPQDSDFSYANSINDLGQTEGNSYNPADESSLATLRNNGVATDLNSDLSASDQSQGWILNYAYDTNDNGSIDDSAYNPLLGAQRDLLLQSVAEVPAPSAVSVPAALPLLASALGMFGIALRRKSTQD